MAATSEDRAAIKRQILAEGRGFFCDICGFDYPESTLRWQSGLRVSTLCDWEPDGGPLERDLMRADADVLGAELTKKEFTVGQYPGRHDGLGSESLTMVSAISPDPVELTVAGGLVDVTVTGENLSTATTFSYGHAQIVGAISVVSDTEILIHLGATAFCPPGDYDLTINTDTVWRKRVKVRR